MICLDVDLSNPGQFFGCCGIFELAQRLWPSTTAYFEGSSFVVSEGTLNELVSRVVQAPMTRLVSSDRAASPVLLGDPFDLRLDWWKDVGGGGRELKTWAGSMQGPRIAEAMRTFLPRAFEAARPFDYGTVVTDQEGKKVEPFYFDARRSGAASAIDTGFSVNDLHQVFKGAATVSFPAVEFLCLVGLQRFRPARVGSAFHFHVWREPLTITLASLAVCGVVGQASCRRKFSAPFHTDYAKSYSAAVVVNGEENE